jgi:hypothetical protein
MRIRCSGNVFTELFPSSGRLFLLKSVAKHRILLLVSRPLPRNGFTRHSIYKGIFFRKVVNTSHDIPWFVQWMGLCDISLILVFALLSEYDTSFHTDAEYKADVILKYKLALCLCATP